MQTNSVICHMVAKWWRRNVRSCSAVVVNPAWKSSALVYIGWVAEARLKKRFNVGWNDNKQRFRQFKVPVGKIHNVA